MALSEMAHIIGKDYTSQKIMPILLELLKDDNSEVKMNVCNGLIKVSSVIGPDVLSPAFIA
jgi:serine/threonine-protein phosphatase 2A regulatory subunit A